MIIEGKPLLMGNNVNTDVLHPSRFFSLDDKTVRSGFMQAGNKAYTVYGESDISGKIVVAGDNFGCGSSRETGARVFLLAGIRAIVARSMARIFSRNVRNLGLPAFECPSLPTEISDEANIKIDFETWSLEISEEDSPFPLRTVDPFWKSVMTEGGLMPFLGFKGI